MAIKECSLYKFIIGGQTIKTTPVDVKARKLANRVGSVVQYGTTRSVTIDLSVSRILFTGHGNRAAFRGVYIIGTDGSVSTVMEASELAVSVNISGGVATLSVTNNTSSQSNARFVVV